MAINVGEVYKKTGSSVWAGLLSRYPTYFLNNGVTSEGDAIWVVGIVQDNFTVNIKTISEPDINLAIQNWTLTDNQFDTPYEFLNRVISRVHNMI